MPYIKVDIDKLAVYRRSFGTCRSNTLAISQSFRGIHKNLDWDIRSSAGIRSQMREIQTEISEIISDITNMQSFISLAEREYAGLFAHTGQNVSKTTTNSAKEGEGGKKGSHTGALSSKLVGSTASTLMGMFGPVGSLTSICVTPFANWAATGHFALNDAGDDLGQTTGKCLKAVVKAGEQLDNFWSIWEKSEKIARFNNPGRITKTAQGDYILDQLFSTKKGYRDILGPNAVISKGAKWMPGNAVEGFKHQLKSNFVSANGKIDGWGIAGDVITLGINGYENYKEFKSGAIGGDRAVVETIAETAFDIIIDAAAIAILGAVCAAVAPVAVPGVAIAAVAGVTIGLIDLAVEDSTGKDMSEHMGSFVGGLWDEGKDFFSNSNLRDVLIDKTNSVHCATSSRAVFA